MTYTGLMLDVDGTLVTYDYYTLPSDKIVEAIAKAQKHLNVSIVTGRSYASLKPILERLHLTTGYAVVNNGAAVIDIQTEKILYERTIDKNELTEIIALFEEKNVPFFLKQSVLDTKKSLGRHPKNGTVTQGSMLFTDEMFTQNEAEEMLESLSKFSTIAAHKQHHGDPHSYSIAVSHAEATKLHGVHEIAKYLALDPKEFIGVGDSYNDFPLLMACGLKVAMGNAASELKAIADYIAPSVEDDGVADVIAKFILNPS